MVCVWHGRGIKAVGEGGRVVCSMRARRWGGRGRGREVRTQPVQPSRLTAVTKSCLMPVLFVFVGQQGIRAGSVFSKCHASCCPLLYRQAGVLFSVTGHTWLHEGLKCQTGYEGHMVACRDRAGAYNGTGHLTWAGA